MIALDAAAAAVGAGIKIWLERTETVAHIRTLLNRGGQGRGRVILVPRLGPARTVEIGLPGGFNVTPRLAEDIKLARGVERVDEL